MPEVQAQARMTSTLSAVLHHADGRPDEDLGVISTTEVEQKEVPRLLQLLKGKRHVNR